MKIRERQSSALKIRERKFSGFPAYRDRVKRLVDQHLAIKDEPLLLAIYYAPDREPKDLFLFEVTENFAAGRIDLDKELFEMAFSSRSGFDIAQGRWAHLVLTNPNELRTAVDEGWPSMLEIRNSLTKGCAEVIYSSPGIGEELLSLLQG